MEAIEFLFLDLNAYFASVEQQLTPALRGKPVAVVPVDTDATCAIAVSYEAKPYGIHTGTPVWEAKKRCPELVCVVARHEAYVDYHHRVLQEVDRHVPIHSVDSIDELSCKLLGKERETVYALDLARRIKQGLRERVGECIRASIGFSSNRFLAKIATDMRKPDGLLILTADMLPHALHGYPLDTLPGIGRNMYRRLLMAGIGDMETLWMQSPRQLRNLWGSVEGERFWYKLRGHELASAPAGEKRSIGHSHVLAPEWRGQEQAWQVAERLLQKAAARLRRHQYYARCLRLSVRLETGHRFALDIRLEAVCDTLTLSRALKILWGQVMAQAGSGRVRKISVGLTMLCNHPQRQEDLFTPASAQEWRRRQERVSRSMDKLNARYGRNTVTMGFLPGRSEGFSGTKVAFTRIPETEEFFE